MPFAVLPERQAAAAENMAVDFMLLQRYPETEYPRFRNYGWHRPAFTFGYSQKIGFVRAQLPTDEIFELCRRPTGGGLVDHRRDWTYALVLPRGHPAEALRALDSYKLVHAVLADALIEAGQPACLQDQPEPPVVGTEGVCFTRPERFDVVAANGQKIAGAAQKRNKHGLLFQGSIARDAIRADLDWEGFKVGFVHKLAIALEAEDVETPWPDWAEEELSGLTEQYSSSEWNEFR